MHAYINNGKDTINVTLVGTHRTYDINGSVVNYSDLSIDDQNYIDIIKDDLYDLPHYSNGKIYVGQKGQTHFYIEQDALIDFSGQLKLARVEARLTRQQFSDFSGFPLRTIENWENGVETPAENVQKYVLDDLIKMTEVKKMSTKTTYYLSTTNAGRQVLAVCEKKAFACNYDSDGIDKNSGCDLYGSTDVLIDWYVKHQDELYDMDDIMYEGGFDVFDFNEDDYENLTEIVSI